MNEVTQNAERLDKLRFSQAQQELINQLEQTSEQFWNISPISANFLNMLIKISGSKNVLEIGTSNGYSGIWLAKALKTTGGRLTTIEFWDNRQNMAIENFKKCEVEDIISTELGSAMDILPRLEQTWDFVFIDANKGEYVKYFDLIDPNLKKGGIIAADNITSHPEKVAPFVDKIQAHPDYQVEILDLPAGMLLAYKLN